MAKRTLRHVALDLLARRSHSVKELSKKLLARDFPIHEIQPLCEILQQDKLLNDENFTQEYIHYRSQKGYGPLRIQAELFQRGIPLPIIENQLKSQHNSWHEKIIKIWKKKFKNQLPKDRKTHAQQMRFLQYRGFTTEQINPILMLLLTVMIPYEDPA
jgi:regulatory protein